MNCSTSKSSRSSSWAVALPMSEWLSIVSRARAPRLSKSPDTPPGDETAAVQPKRVDVIDLSRSGLIAVKPLEDSIRFSCCCGLVSVSAIVVRITCLVVARRKQGLIQNQH